MNDSPLSALVDELTKISSPSKAQVKDRTDLAAAIDGAQTALRPLVAVLDRIHLDPGAYGQEICQDAGAAYRTVEPFTGSLEHLSARLAAKPSATK